MGYNYHLQQLASPPYIYILKTIFLDDGCFTIIHFFITGLDKFISTHPFFRARIFTCSSSRTRKKTVPKTKVRVPSISNYKHCFSFFITYVRLAVFTFNVFPLKTLAICFCSLNFVWISKIRYLSRKNFILHMKYEICWKHEILLNINSAKGINCPLICDLCKKPSLI